MRNSVTAERSGDVNRQDHPRAHSAAAQRGPSGPIFVVAWHGLCPLLVSAAQRPHENSNLTPRDHLPGRGQRLVSGAPSGDGDADLLLDLLVEGRSKSGIAIEPENIGVALATAPTGVTVSPGAGVAVQTSSAVKAG